MSSKTIAFALAALSVELTVAGNAPPREFRLLPYGHFKAADGSGRPLNLPQGWLLTPQRAVAVAAAFNARSDARVIDFEHQTLHAAENGKPAPAAGWIGKLEPRADGLYAVDVEWTATAAAMVEAREYRYISPVFPFDKRTGEVLAVAHAALVNYAGLDGLTDLAALSAFAQQFLPAVQPQEEMPMKALLAALGLPDAATEAEALAALAALKSTHQGELVALKGAQALTPPDPAKYVELAVLSGVQGELSVARTELAALKAEKTVTDVDKVVTDALAAGKLTPATETWARALGKTDLAALKAFVAAAPAVMVPGTTQTGGAGKPDAGNSQPSDVDVAVMKALGLSAEQFAAGKKEV